MHFFSTSRANRSNHELLRAFCREIAVTTHNSVNRELGAVFGGFTPLLATALFAAYHTGMAVAALTMVMCAISMAAVAWS
jgi:VIT1/CCC1 family predicted Fe2+/Mn2+ transporter